MTKTVSTSKKIRKQHSPEFLSEALKLAERIGIAAAARDSACISISALCVVQQTAATNSFVIA